MVRNEGRQVARGRHADRTGKGGMQAGSEKGWKVSTEAGI